MGEHPLFHDEEPLNTIVIGVPALVCSCIGAITALIFLWRISSYNIVPDDKGDATRKQMADAMRELSHAIGSGAQAFLVKEYSYLICVSLCLFVLVSVVVDWRTGLW